MLAVFFLSGCSAFNSRPVKQMAYAESAFQAATYANAETIPEASQIFQLARDQLSRARSYYRLKNFKQARLFAIKSRRMSEEAEWRALKSNMGSKEAEPLVR
jgi:hypothetical protein